MQSFVLLLFLVVTLASYAASFGGLRLLGYLPELMSLLVLPYIIFEGARRRFPLLAPKYCFAFGAIALICVCGIVSNGVDSAPLENGLRFYLRALPFFFLPAVVELNEQQIGRQLRWLLGLALLQLPVSAYQRLVVFSEGRFSGDSVVGTVTDSGVLSIFLIGSALVLTGMYLRGHIGKWRLFPLLALLLFPTSINETKVTAIYIPLGFLITLLIGSRPGQRMRVLRWSAVLIAAFGMIYVSVYSLTEASSPYKDDQSIVSFFSDQKGLDRYFFTNKATGPGTREQAARGDSLIVPFSYLAADPIRLALGLGLGNTSPSTLGANYQGRYNELFRPYLQTSLTYFLLEIGLLGVGALLVLYWLLFADAVAVSRDSSLFGAIAVGWTGITVLMCISLIYSPIHMFSTLSYLYWYFSGVVAASRVALARANTVRSSGFPARSAA